MKPCKIEPNLHTASTIKYGGFFDVEKKEKELKDIEVEIESRPDFWTNPDVSAPVLKKKSMLENGLNRAKKLAQSRDDLSVALELAAEGEDEYLQEAESLLNYIEEELDQLEVESLLSGDMDGNDAVVTLNAGAGGTESCDWASMLFRMYLRYAERKGWKTEIFDLQDGDEAGIKSATFQISGEFSFGLLKAESGVHRLVRISPFDSNARRHTSFASVFVTPVVDDNIDIEVNEGDIRVDTYRASGAGGQHINKTDSAVRMTHIPTGIVVQCQTQRSQHQNRDQCMKLLKSKLYEMEMEERRKAQEAAEGAKSEIGWGSQIRSYVLHPYKMVKDHRTNLENHSPDDVLDGGLEGFINEFLSKSYDAANS
ncbi:peptide chain release factor 2 [Pseudobacteriovorax antillogorgiicola]|uniref:peptide chain release factor 2 n=1 Tax=Pseudobacteriovorax antillogorgiicola TaxID=1513793 RepID=UPI00190EB645|nr:peptide chain release factor 2 [Pseudobacteriovorax antillogorgiicola]